MVTAPVHLIRLLSVAGQVVTVNNANQFFDNQIVQVFTAAGVLLGTFQVLTADAIANTLTADPHTPLPAAYCYRELPISKRMRWSFSGFIVTKWNQHSPD